MIQHHLLLAIEPWDDGEFRTAAETAMADLRAGGLDPDSEAAAVALQERLRERGYPGATVETHRSVEEVLGHRARFVVRRGPR